MSSYRIRFCTSLLLILAASWTAIAADDKPPGTDEGLVQARWKKLLGATTPVLGFAAGLDEARFSGRPLLVFVAVHGDARTDMLSEWILLRPKVLPRLENMIVVAVDAKKDPESARALDRYEMAEPHPYLRFVDPKGEAVGVQVGFVGDAVPFPPQMESFFLKHLGAALRSMQPLRITPAYRKLRSADADLTKAMQRESHGKAVKAVLAIEKIGRAGAEMERAKLARTQLEKLAAVRMTAAEAKVEEDRALALRLFKKVATDFRGLQAADTARARVRELKKPT